MNQSVNSENAEQAGTPLPVTEIAITQAMIDRYAALSGDFNPLHVDQQMAEQSMFGGTIAHGCIPMEPIFQALHRWLGRPDLANGTTMSLRYHRPSQPGDTIRLEAQAMPAEDGKDIRTVQFACINQRGEKVIDGHCRLPGVAADAQPS